MNKNQQADVRDQLLTVIELGTESRAQLIELLHERDNTIEHQDVKIATLERIIEKLVEPSTSFVWWGVRVNEAANQYEVYKSNMCK
jgi:hypothetical protein